MLGINQLPYCVFLSHLMPLLTNVAHLDAGTKWLISWRLSEPSMYEAIVVQGRGWP
jgi:hypothetical protein